MFFKACQNIDWSLWFRFKHISWGHLLALSKEYQANIRVFLCIRSHQYVWGDLEAIGCHRMCVRCLISLRIWCIRESGTPWQKGRNPTMLLIVGHCVGFESSTFSPSPLKVFRVEVWVGFCVFFVATRSVEAQFSWDSSQFGGFGRIRRIVKMFSGGLLSKPSSSTLSYRPFCSEANTSTPTMGRLRGGFSK